MSDSGPPNVSIQASPGRNGSRVSFSFWRRDVWLHTVIAVFVVAYLASRRWHCRVPRALTPSGTEGCTPSPRCSRSSRWCCVRFVGPRNAHPGCSLAWARWPTRRVICSIHSTIRIWCRPRCPPAATTSIWRPTCCWSRASSFSLKATLVECARPFGSRASSRVSPWRRWRRSCGSDRCSQRPVRSGTSLSLTLTPWATWSCWSCWFRASLRTGTSPTYPWPCSSRPWRGSSLATWCTSAKVWTAHSSREHS